MALNVSVLLGTMVTSVRQKEMNVLQILAVQMQQYVVM